MVKMYQKIRFLILIIVLISLTSFLTLAEDSTENDCLYYFYGEKCPDCEQINTFLLTLNQKYPNLNLQKFEVYYNLDNSKLLDTYLKNFGITEESQGLPIIFLESSYFVGKKSITTLLEERIKNHHGSACPSLEKTEAIGVVGLGSSIDVLDTLTFFNVTGSAFADLFKPGALALLLILLIILSVTRNNQKNLIKEEHEDDSKKVKDDYYEKLLKRGILFIAGIYLAYFIFGIGWLDWFYRSTITHGFTKIIGFSAIIFALVKIKAFFKTWKMLFKNFPQELKDKLKKIAGYFISFPGVFLTGLIISLFTFSGASQTLILIRNLFAGGIKRVVVLPLLLYYNLIFILIPLAIVILLYFAKQKLAEKADKKSQENDQKKEAWKKHYHKLLNLGINLIILILGLVVLFA